MAKQDSTRGLTRIDAVVLLAAWLLLALLVPMLIAKPRERGSRMLCGANLARIGKTMLIYANDYGGVLPRPGDRYAKWGPIADWLAGDRKRAYGINDADPWDPNHRDGQVSFSSCFYLLVKYYGALPRLFICSGDVRAKELNLFKLPPGVLSSGCKLADLWDFGPTMSEATKACSYSYHVPFGLYGLTTARDPNSPVAADRNPWINSPGADAKWFPGAGTDLFRPDCAPYDGSSAQARNGNAIPHQMDGQNVLFLDGRVTFETRPYCGIRSNSDLGPYSGRDNIYTLTDWVPGGSPFGTAPTSSAVPYCRGDSLLLHDDPKSGEPFMRPERRRP